MKRYLRLFLLLIFTFSVMASVSFNTSANDINTLTFEDSAEQSSLAENAGEGNLRFFTDVVYDGCYGNQLTGTAEEFYDALVSECAEKGSANEFTVTLKTPFTFGLKLENNTLYPDEDFEDVRLIISASLQSATDAFRYDYPDVFWFGNVSISYGYSWEKTGEAYTGTLSQITVTPTESYTGAASKSASFASAVDTAVIKIKDSVTDLNSRYEVLKAIHDYICNNTYYGEPNALLSHSAEGFFLGDSGVVCEGYAKAFKIICDEFNIPCALISGDAGGAHMWNYVQAENGKWYLVDITWDDQNSEIYYTYFLACLNSQGFDGKISDERTEEGDFSDTGYMTFAYPQISSDEYTVHIHSWESTYTVDKQATCAEKGSKSIHCSECTQVKDITETEKLPHTFTVYTSDNNATCISDGTKTSVCDICKTAKDTVTDEGSVNKNNHKAVTDKAVSASCTKTGLTEGSHCGLCEKVLVRQKTVYPLGHSSDGGKITRTANYKQWGLKEYRCTDCSSLLYSENIERLTLTAPGKVKISAVKTTSFKVSWSKVQGAEVYRVYYSLDGKKWKTEEVKGATSLKLKNLKKGKKYFVKVVAAASDNNSEESKTVKTTTLPVKVTVKRLKAVKTRQAEIKWKTTASATGYEISYSTSKKFTKKTTNKVTVKKQKTNKKTVKKLKKGKKYYFRVRAYTILDGKKVYGEWSKVKSVKIK